MILAAVDPRVTVAVPAVMVSTAMQGGCTCENCSLLRVDTGNVEFAALLAPKPQLVTTADDWTREMSTKGYPELRRHYAALKAEDKLAISDHTEFKHNYNYVNRAAMYDWMNRHLKLGHEGPIVEPDYTRLTAEQMTVWNDDHPRPAGGFEYEQQLIGWLAADARRQLASAAPRDEASLAKYKELVGAGIDAVIGRGLPSHEAIDYKQSVKNDEGAYLEMAGVLNYTAREDRNEQLPLVFLYPKDWNKQVVVWVRATGKAGLYDEDGPITDRVKDLMRAGTCVIGVDLFQQGEFLAEGEAAEPTRRVKNTREAAAYTFGYNHSVFARRVHDLLTLAAYLKNHGLAPEEIVFVGLDEVAGPLVACVRAQARDAVDRAAVQTHGFRFGRVDDLHSQQFLPGGAKYDDLPGMLAVAAPLPLWLAGEGQGGPKLVQDAYTAAGGSEEMTAFAGKPAEIEAAAVKWILGSR